MKSTYVWSTLCNVAFFACSGGSVPGEGGEATMDGMGADAGLDGSESQSESQSDASKPTGQCAATFGDRLTEGFGRIDGIVYAIQKPSDTQCVYPNKEHVIVQVLMNGAVYRLVVNVQGAGADKEIRIGQLPHRLPAPAFAEGWHANVELDYVSTLGAHADAFAAFGLDDGVARVGALLAVGDPVSVYGTCGDGRPESAHLVHRNRTNEDGAIVANPMSNPTFLLFHFGDQTF